MLNVYTSYWSEYELPNLLNFWVDVVFWGVGVGEHSQLLSSSVYVKKNPILVNPYSSSCSLATLFRIVPTLSMFHPLKFPLIFKSPRTLYILPTFVTFRSTETTQLFICSYMKCHLLCISCTRFWYLVIFLNPTWI